MSTELRRSMGLAAATSMVVGIIVGASIFVQPAEVTRLVPNRSGVILAWLISGVLTLCAALVCAELARLFPNTGGVYVFLKQIYSAGAGISLGMDNVLCNACGDSGSHCGGARALCGIFLRLG